jgi:hypothetical protein
VRSVENGIASKTYKKVAAPLNANCISDARSETAPKSVVANFLKVFIVRSMCNRDESLAPKECRKFFVCDAFSRKAL